MLTQEIIRRKRDGKALDVALIDEFVAGITSGDVAHVPTSPTSVVSQRFLAPFKRSHFCCSVSECVIHRSHSFSFPVSFQDRVPCSSREPHFVLYLLVGSVRISHHELSHFFDVFLRHFSDFSTTFR